MTVPEDTDITDLTVQDILDDAGGQPYHTILEVWREVLQPSEQERYKKITPQWANRICSTYRDMHFADMPAYRDAYFDKIMELQAILIVEISSDDECLNWMTPEEDAQQNSFHYVNILINWQKALLQWELNWECTDLHAAIELAAISEVHRMFFDNTGLTSLLDNIQFEFTESDQELLAQELYELRGSQEGQ